jgi:MtaA/CmuA family methyltransferase
MDCLERCLRAVRREVPDRVPVVPLIISHAVKQAGVAFSEYNRNPELIASVQACAWRRYGYDGIHITTDNWILPQALGYPSDIMTICRRWVWTVRWLPGGTLPCLPPLTEAKTAARMGLLPEATRCARRLLGDTCFIKTNFDQGPFSLASAVRGIEALMMDMADQPQFVFDLLEISVEMVSHLGIEVGRTGAHAVTFGDAVAGLVSREDFVKFAFPRLKEVVRRLHAAIDAPVFLHICGKTTHIVDCMAATGADALELDFQNDFGEMKRMVGDEVCLEGNLEPSGVLLQGTPQLVYRKSRELIQSAGPGGFILSSGCEVPRDTPPENIEAMVQAARDNGGY